MYTKKMLSTLYNKLIVGISYILYTFYIGTYLVKKCIFQENIILSL